MLRVRRDKQAAEGTTSLERAPTVEREMAGVQPAGGPPLAGNLHFSQVVAILVRRKSLVLAIAVIGTLLAAVVGLLIPPRYTATAQLVAEAPVSPTDRTPGVLALYESIDTHVTLLSSRDHLRRVIESFEDYPEPGPAARDAAEPAPVNGTGRDELQSAAGDQSTGATAMKTIFTAELQRRLTVWLGEFRRSESATVPRLDAFVRNTGVIQERRSRVISVAFTSTSPEKAAAFANRIVQLYVDGLSEQKQASANREMAELDQRIAQARHETERAKAVVQQAIQQGRSSGQKGGSEERADEEQLREFLRHAGGSAQRLDILLRSRKELSERQRTSSGAGIQLLLAGVPNRPSSHNPILFIFPAFIVFAIGGSWLAVVLERLDRGLRGQQETADALGIPCIGLVPRLPRKHAARPDRYLLTRPSSAYAEAIRSVVATLGLASARSSRVVLISSSIPGEGKTTLARSLATYAGFLGRRTLLIDLDLRPGPQHGKLHDAGRVVDLFAQDCTPIELIRHVADSRFDYLPMAGSRLDPLAVIASDQMPSLIRQLRERYDCVIIDGPPVLGAVEARLLPSVADELLLVVKWGSTRREVSQNALSLLRQPGRLNDVGDDHAMAIVTQVDLRKHARYRYGDVGEYLIRHNARRSRPREAPPDTGREEAAKANTRQVPFRSTESSPNASNKLEGPKTEQASRSKASGEESDGCTV